MKRVLFGTILLGGFITSAYAEKLAIVIDDSAGMCGYLAAPIEKNAYKKALKVLLQARDVSNLNVQAYYLSNINKPMPIGLVLDNIIKSTSDNCPFKAVTSPLHAGLDYKKMGADAVIMVTDLLFDEGSAGSSDSRSTMINQFDELATSQQKNVRNWFNTSAGIIGIKSDFGGVYYSIHGSGKADFNKKSVERPFYWLWMSKTPKFFPYINQMNNVWGTVNWSNKKNAVEGVYALRILPLTEIVSPKQGLFLAPPKNTLNKSKLNKPEIYYGKAQNKKVLDEILSLDYSGKYPIPQECLKTTDDPLKIQLFASCANGGSNQGALFNNKNFPQSIMLSYPLTNSLNGIQRNFVVTSSEEGFSHPVEANYRNTNDSQVFQQYKGKYPASLVLQIQGLKTSRSILFNSPSVKQKTLILNIKESYKSNELASQNILPLVRQYWSDIKEPCLEDSIICKKANSSTYQFEELINSVTARISANQKTVAILNQNSIPAQIEISLEQSR